MSACEKCSLHKSCRTNRVGLSGDDQARVLFVGEAPGAEEDADGEPFVGRAGQLLRDTISTSFPDDEGYALTNVVKCRPPNNREPTQEEIKACAEWLQMDVDSMPKLEIVVAVGNVALKALYGRQGITRWSGKVVGDLTGYPGVQLMAILHPAYILRNQPEIKKFREHMGRIASALKGELTNESDKGKYIIVNTDREFEEMLSKISRSRYFVYDIETSGLSPYRNGEIKCIAISTSNLNAWVLPVTFLSNGRWVEKIKELFQSKRIGKVGHHVKFDNGWVEHILGCKVQSTIWDTAISQFLINEIEGVGLKELAWKYTHLGGYEKRLPSSPETCEPGKALYEYCATDADITHRIFTIHQEELKKDPKLLEIFKSLMMPASEVLMRMEQKGIRINRKGVEDAIDQVTITVDDLVSRMRNCPSVQQYESNAKVFNPNSHIQLREILFDIEALPIIKTTDKKGAPSTDKEVLSELSEQSPLCKLLLDYGQVQSSHKFAKEMMNEMDSNDRIHTSYNLTVARTGRTSSSNPNLQNIPKGDKDLLKLRRCFEPDDGFTLVEADYNQHELRVLAEISKDVNLQKALKGDVHIATAAAILGKRPEDITSEERRTVGKTFNFGLVYGMTPYGLMRRLGCSESDARNFLMRFFGEYAGVDRWMKETEAYVKEHHFVRTLSGRVRRFPAYDKLEDSNIREAINTPIQGTASDILLYALVGIEEFLKHNNLKSFLTLQVHDSIVMNVHNSEVRILGYIKHIMLHHFKKFFPFESDLAVDFKAGTSWGDMEDVPVKEAGEDS